MKEESNEAKGFKDSVRELLGLDKGLNQEMLNGLREGVIEIGQKTGDTNSEDVLDNCIIELSKLKDDQTKAIIVVYLLSTLPLELQKFLIEQHKEILLDASVKNLMDSEDGGLMAFMALMSKDVK